MSSSKNTEKVTLNASNLELVTSGDVPMHAQNAGCYNSFHDNTKGNHSFGPGERIKN
jgi:hypothetical protein